MAYEKIIRPTQTFRGGAYSNQLDVRVVPLEGEDLANVIEQSVAHTQKFIITDLPSWLILSHRQFVSLLPYTEEMYQTSDRLYRTPHNVMEVVVDVDLDTVQPEEVVITSDRLGEDWDEFQASI